MALPGPRTGPGVAPPGRHDAVTLRALHPARRVTREPPLRAKTMITTATNSAVAALAMSPIDWGLSASAILLVIFAARALVTGEGKAQMGCGFMFVAAAVGTFAIGRQVDGFGLVRAMFMCSLAGLGAATDGPTKRDAGAAGKREGRRLVDLR